MRLILVVLLFINVYCFSQESELEKKQLQDTIIKEYIHNCAQSYNYNLQMEQWQDCLDKGLEKDSTIAYLWQQKAMPYFKIKKYEVGMQYLDKAVIYNETRWQPYRAFIKCIFSKTYKDAIQDFESCLEKWGDNYVMDHTFSFYIGLCYLQLNEFENAENYLESTISQQEKQFGEAHFLDLFYYAITKYEQHKYDEAIVLFNKSLEEYPKFSDAVYYKALCYWKQNKPAEIYENLIEQAKKYAQQGYTITEDNTVYEPYPYQVKWKPN